MVTRARGRHDHPRIPRVKISLRQRRAEALASARVHTAPPQRWQHGQDLEAGVAPRMPTSVASSVQLLRRANAIGDAEVEAARRFWRDYVFGVEGVRDPQEGGRPSGVSDAHNAQVARAEAIGRHREITEVIGAKMTAWLISLVVLDLSFAAMQREYMPGPLAGRTEMRGRMTAVLQLLSRLYAAIDRRRRVTP
jgi:hypothetical protein